MTTIDSPRRSALQALIESDSQRLRRRSISLGVNPSDADDVAQSIALRAWRSVETIRSFSTGSLCAWLDVIARNTAIDALRTGKFMVVALDESLAADADPVGDVETNQLLQTVVEHINALPERLRVPFVLSVVDRLSTAEIADRLDITPASVRQRVSRARKALAHLRPEVIPHHLLER